MRNLRLRRSSRRHVLKLLRIVILLVCSSRITAPTAQETTTPNSCGKLDPMIGGFLQCVTKLMESRPDNFSEPVHGYLVKLAESVGYEGLKSDLEKLKDRSTILKHEPVKNRDTIALLDDAIASHSGELRSAVSYRALATQVSPGTDVFPRFVNQKLGFLNSDRAKFYDSGPFEMARRSLLAGALENEYFLDATRGLRKPETLYQELAIIEEVLERLNSPQYAYLPIRQGNKSQINSHKFWTASLRFVLGESPKVRDILHELAISSRPFGLQTKNAGHIYIYNVFNVPYKIIVGANDEVNLKDFSSLNRFYNPAQLALVACAQLQNAGETNIDSFVAAVSGLIFNDYYVVIGTADDRAELEPLRDTIKSSVASNGGSDRLRDLVADQETKGLANTMKRGAQECGIDDSIRDEIYSRFQFVPGIEPSDEGARQFQLVLGGRLNKRQAVTIAEFLKQMIDQVPALSGKIEATKIKIDRMPIDPQ
jgi:hypothetical protein